MTFLSRLKTIHTKRAVRQLKSSLLALGAGIGISAALVSLSSTHPMQTLAQFFSGPFSAPYYTGSMLNTAALLAFGALGAACAIVSGSFNLGGEGQIYLSGFTASLILSAAPPASGLLPAGCVLLIAAAAAFLVSGAIAAFCGIMKVYRNVSELLSSFLLSAASIPLIDAAIAGPFRDAAQNLLATPRIAQELRFTQLLPPSAFNISFFAAIALCAACAFMLYGTQAGKRLRICGAAEEFARYSGLRPQRAVIAGMFISGGMHGLAGFCAAAGTYYCCPQGFYAGMGWNALTAALIARCHPLAIMPACLVLGWLFSAADKAILTNNLTIDVTGIIQAAILLCISAQFIVRIKKEQS